MLSAPPPWGAAGGSAAHCGGGGGAGALVSGAAAAAEAEAAAREDELVPGSAGDWLEDTLRGWAGDDSDLVVRAQRRAAGIRSAARRPRDDGTLRFPALRGFGCSV
jgi:hypothetical protein